MNGDRLFRRPKLTLSCSAEGKEGRKEGRKEGKKEERNYLKFFTNFVFVVLILTKPLAISIQNIKLTFLFAPHYYGSKECAIF
jgi:hypothetical protein